MARNPKADPPAVKAWVRTQEAIMDLEDAIEDLRKRMIRSPGHPALSAEDQRYFKVLEKLTMEVRDIEKEIAADQLDELKSERDDVKAMRTRVKRKRAAAKATAATRRAKR
jgi:hypothetical protein